MNFLTSKVAGDPCVVILIYKADKLRAGTLQAYKLLNHRKLGNPRNLHILCSFGPYFQVFALHFI
jgi:hypothetical protein